MLRVANSMRALAIGLLTIVAPVSASALTTVSVDAYDSGWYRSDGFHSSGNTNFITGNIGTSSYNNFFAFDLSGVVGQIVGATLEFGSIGRYLNAPRSADYTVSQVSTGVSSLLAGTGGTAAFADLASGTTYGSTTIDTRGRAQRTMPTVTVLLNNALDDLNSAKGSQIAFGGSTTAADYFWGYSNGPNGVRVVLTVDPTVVLPIPAPVVLLLTAFGALALAGRRAACRQVA